MNEHLFNNLRIELETIAYENGEYRSGRMNSAPGKAFKQKLEEIEFNGFITLQDKIFALKNNYFERPSCSCGIFLKANSNGKMQQYCSQKCAATSKKTIEKRENTVLQKYGVNHVSQLESTQLKIKSTNQELYGANASWAGPSIREKAKQTNIKIYGVENPAQAECVINKIKNSHANRTKHAKQQTVKQIQETSLAKYGVKHYMKNHEMQQIITKRVKETFILNVLPSHFDNLENELGIKAMFEPREWKNSYTKYKWKHLECNKIFEAAPRFSRMAVCPFCKRKSKVQELVESFVNDSGIEYIPEDRSLISPYELDIYIPSKKLAIEINGTFWHHDLAPQLPLLEKTKLAEAQGIALLHFWDHEISEKPEVIKNIIFAKLGVLPKIPGRKVEARTITSAETRMFFEKYHLQGATNSSFSIGLYYNGELVQAASFGTPRFGSKEGLELIRFASKPITIHGGFSKILSHLRKDHAGERLITFADRRISVGNVYKMAGFSELKTSGPNYFYIKNGIILPRYKAMKHKLPKIVQNFNPNLSELENMRLDGWVKCLDCGNLKFEITL